MMLIYPVISFNDTIGHTGSRTKLLGPDATPEKVRAYSSEWQVTQETPPAFLVHASDDDGVLPFHSIVFYEHLRKHGVKAELHIYQNGGHGFGMNNKTTTDKWMDRGFAWLQANGWMKSK
jgi:dipeptidyl aminopeptidase/acylaminoacyl peptidase